MKAFKKLTEDYFVGNLGSIESTNEVLTSVKTAKHFDYLEETSAKVGDGNSTRNDYRIRNCFVKWFDVDNVNFIETGLRQIIRQVNSSSWNLNLEHKWQTKIQYTKYAGKGHFYNWHKDYYSFEESGVVKPLRKISIVYCLSYKTDYVGGEFQIKLSNGETYTRKFDYGDFIVFPSNKIHRVKKLKSGERVTLVGWYY